MDRMNRGTTTRRGNDSEIASGGLPSLGAALLGKLRSWWGGSSSRGAASRAADLAAAAGRGPAGFEQLEQRQLMFALTVTADDVAGSPDGLGTVEAYFQYAIPYMFTDEDPDDGDPQEVTEDFNDEQGAVPRNILSGTNFLASGLRAITNIFPSSNATLRAVSPQQNNERFIEVLISNNQFFGFQFLGQQTGLPTIVRQFQFETRAVGGSQTGLNTDGIAVQLFFQGELVDTITGARLRAASSTGTGVGVFTINAPAANPAFDEIRLLGVQPGNARFQIDNTSWLIPNGQFAGIVTSRLFGAYVTMTGPVGARVEFLDLYGRPMQQRINTGQPQGSPVPIIDIDDDGVPNFNDGIGQVRISGTDNRTSITLWGTDRSVSPPPPDSDFVQGGFGTVRTGEFAGRFDDFEEAGFGFDLDDSGSGVIGLPDVGGGLVIGSPFVRNLNNYNPVGGTALPITTGFTRSDQGIVITDGSSLNGLYVHGVLFGQSRFTGSVDRLFVGYMLGSITVDGDLGALVTQTDASLWIPDGADNNAGAVDTGAQLIVGRSVGEISIGGRSLLDITVAGDLNSPGTRPPGETAIFWEKEQHYQTVAPATEATVVDIMLGQGDYVRRRNQDAFKVQLTWDQKLPFSTNFYRNDSILSSEFVGSVSTGVRILGGLSGRDVTQEDGEDDADVYAFAVDGEREVMIDGETTALIRVIDSRGRTVASTPVEPSLVGAQRIRFTPETAGVFYLVVTDSSADDTGAGVVPYSVLISGLAPVALGVYRTAGNLGGTTSASLNVLSGSAGELRIGTGSSLAGGDGDPSAAFNSGLGNADANMDWLDSTISVSGNLYAINVGADIADDARVFVGGNLGRVFVGASPVAGIGVNEGDANFFKLTVNGSIASVDIGGGVGMDQDNTNDPRAIVAGDFTIGTVIRSGAGGGRGDIGSIRIGFHVGGDSLTVQTSPGSVVGSFLTSQDAYTDDDARSGFYGGERGVRFLTGAGSDVRFADLMRRDTRTSPDTVVPLPINTPVDIIDDGGARVRITASTGGFIRVISVDNGQGVAIGQIVIPTLVGGTLLIEGQAQSNPNAVASIGRIVVNNADATSQVLIRGEVQVDVYRLDVLGGGVGLIENSTPGGDFVAIDTPFVDQLLITRGNLGRTQVPSVGPDLIGPILGVQAGYNTAARGALGIPRSIGTDQTPTMTDSWNGGTYRPAGAAPAGQARFLDDVGGPFDDRLDGLVIRSGSATQTTILVSGAVGDVIGQASGATGVNIAQLTANSDNLTAPGAFEGIFGVVFANNIANINVGDGLARRTSSPLLNSGIFATDDLELLTGRPNASLQSVIIALGDETFEGNDGILSIDLENGSIVDAFIGSVSFDLFWDSPLGEIGGFYRSDIVSITLGTGNILRSEITSVNLGTVELNEGAWDASIAQVSNTITRLSAAQFRNSTLSGGRPEVRFNQVQAGVSIDELATTNAAGDIVDLEVAVTGPLERVSARGITRSTFEVDASLDELAVRWIRASQFSVGAMDTLSLEDIAASTLEISGRVESITATGQIYNSRISITGPDGSIGTIAAATLISGEISTSLGVESIQSGRDIDARLTTGANVGRISATRDVRLVADIGGDLGAIEAGRHIGSLVDVGTILVRGSLTGGVSVGGQLYNDLRVGQQIVGAVVLNGAVSHRPGNDLLGRGSIIASGRISRVDVAGDFGGDIISYSGGIGSVAINNGSLLSGRTVAAFEGSLESFVITAGHLLGNLHADVDLSSVRINPSGDGVFGDVGVNPALSAVVGADALRNQLPVGTVQSRAVQGPRISAGRDVVSFVVAGGSVFETTFVAGRSILQVDVIGEVRNDNVTTGTTNFFIAGDLITRVFIAGNASDVLFLSGVVSLGSDDRAGGIGALADTLKPGAISDVTIGGDGTNVGFTAGMTAGADGAYLTGDDRVLLGQSRVDRVSINGNAANARVFADEIGGEIFADAKFDKGGFNFPADNALIDTGAGTPGERVSGTRRFDLAGGASATITFEGPGDAFFDASTVRLTLRGTNGDSTLTIDSTTTSTFTIVSGDEASLGRLNVAGIAGALRTVIDGSVTVFSASELRGGLIEIGGNVGSISTGAWQAGFLVAQNAGDITINGDFGNTNRAVRDEASIGVLSAGAIRINGAARANISVDRSATSLTLGALSEVASFRFGGSVGGVSAGVVRETFIAAGDSLGDVTLSGESFDSQFMAGVDLGRDAVWGGTGVNADRLSDGVIGNVAIGGNFLQSDITAGLLRGPDGFFGTSDDRIAGGRSTIGTVTITGTQTGSLRNSESYRISSTGTLGEVRVGDRTFVSEGNTLAGARVLAPEALTVDELRNVYEAQNYTASITFNQPIDSSSIRDSVSLLQVLGDGSRTIRLIPGVDYTIAFDSANNSVQLTVRRDITSQNLPRVSGIPSAGIYRVEIDQDLVRANLVSARLDGDGNQISEPGDDYSEDTILGDAGDKLVDTVTNALDEAGQPVHRVDFYSPIDLGVVLDANRPSNGFADPNRTFTVRGFIGDHPDQETRFFGFAGDVDVYQITLRAGQILRLSGLSGPADNALVSVLTPFGDVFGDTEVINTAEAVSLPVDPDLLPDVLADGPNTYLIRTTGVYRIVVGNNFAVTQPTVVLNPDSSGGQVGEYRFDVTVFDDLDTGFGDPNDSGNGDSIPSAPAVIAFAGVDRDFATTADNLSQIVIAGFTFTLDVGADGAPNTSDDVVTGQNASGRTIVTRSSDRQTVALESAVGTPDQPGAPSRTVSPDVDVYHLNNRAPIEPNTRVRITVRLASLGANIGVRNLETFADYTGDVQFGVFDSFSATGVSDANMLFSPTDFSALGGTPDTVIASGLNATYGYDANGDFYVDFVTPQRVGGPTGAGPSLSVYLQGVYNANYQIEVVTFDRQSTDAVFTRLRQNVFLETRGGLLDWLNPSGELTTVQPFNASILGYTGTLPNGRNANEYILSSVTASLNAAFAGAGLDVRFSTDVTSFERQDFSTVYLSDSQDFSWPLYENNDVLLFGGGTFGRDAGFSDAFFDLTTAGFRNQQPYGFSEHSDIFNADVRDEAVVFAPSLSLLGLTPSQADADLLIQSLTAAIGRRVGELVGLRIEGNNLLGSTIFSLMSANSVDNQPGPGLAYSLPQFGRQLSSSGDSESRTSFYLGSQAARPLLQQILGS
ncbi:MAG: hypothetical protein SFZ23_06050 [Planctomycetota bacterium]|nr:hypothetical protein [Planctomycetota bacterium]